MTCAVIDFEPKLRDRMFRGMSGDNPGQDVPLSLCPGTKIFPCSAVPLSWDMGRSKNPMTNSSVLGRPLTKLLSQKKPKKQKKDILKQEKDVLKEERTL